ncbi:hypothetical protein PO903_05220 [Paenibacillus sp. PK4536]|uniref:hypothetical protein n=1 Tax=Paenibacillus sp. PK4536 TaxID=3024576 RepID=UPI0023587957|nr:hypothetical protein [Paenibacillus sp. PK4536]WIM40292.1 hypothetical protein PO903_05220 [Paenibacillus sp. PK4536]
MFQVNSYLLKPQCKINNLNDVVQNPQNYFIEITDRSKLKEIHKDLNFQYLNGSINLKYYEESILDMRHWDLIDQLWAYMMNLIEETLKNGEGSLYFPDQPIKIVLCSKNNDLLLFSVISNEVKNYLLPEKFFFETLVHGAEQFFVCMSHTFNFDCDYSYELERIAKLKQELK